MIIGTKTTRFNNTYITHGLNILIRHNSHPAFTPEPDVVHELVGHGAMLVEPKFIMVNRLFGKVATTADDILTEKLIRLYW